MCTVVLQQDAKFTPITSVLLAPLESDYDQVSGQIVEKRLGVPRDRLQAAQRISIRQGLPDSCIACKSTRWKLTAAMLPTSKHATEPSDHVPHSTADQATTNGSKAAAGLTLNDRLGLQDKLIRRIEALNLSRRKAAPLSTRLVAICTG